LIQPLGFSCHFDTETGGIDGRLGEPSTGNDDAPAFRSYARVALSRGGNDALKMASIAAFHGEEGIWKTTTLFFARRSLRKGGADLAEFPALICGML